MPLTKVKVKLIGKDGNAFAIIGTVRNALIKAGRKDLADEYRKKAMAGDYNNVLMTTMDYVEIR